MKIVLNGRRFRTREKAHRYLRRRLRFPRWYGGNLDALADLMGERAHIEVEIKKPEYIAQSLGEYGELMVKILTRSV